VGQTFIITVNKINKKFSAAGGNCVLCQGGDYVCQNVRSFEWLYSVLVNRFISEARIAQSL
jgi:hypothetical protein